MRRTLATTVNEEQYTAIELLAARSNVSVSAYLYAIIIDVLADEGFNIVVQRKRAPGRTPSGERIQASGAGTS